MIDKVHRKEEAKIELNKKQYERQQYIKQVDL